MIPFSILDLSPIVEGGDAAQALRNTIDLAQHAERWGYHRYWLAEHHNIPSVASAATSVVICAVAGRTSTIRVGAGGIMSGADAREKTAAGASLVQLYTGLVYRGPGLVGECVSEIKNSRK